MSKRWVTTNHAIKRATERFGVKKHGVENWVNQKMAEAKYLSNVIDKNGNECRSFSCNGVILLADLKSDKIITVLKPTRMPQFTNKLRKIAEKELTSTLKTEVSELRKLEILRAELEIEIGELRLKGARARSLPRKLAIKGRIKALEMRLDELPEEVFEVKRNKTRKINAIAQVI